MAALTSSQALSLLKQTNESHIVNLISTGDNGNVYISRISGMRGFALLSTDEFDGIKFVNPERAVSEIVRLTGKGWDADIKLSTNWTASG